MKIAFRYGLISTMLISIYYIIPILNDIKTMKSGIYIQSDMDQLIQLPLITIIVIFLFLLPGWIFTAYMLRRERRKLGLLEINASTQSH
jgi:hypothetical protein